ncbi:MAG: VWA domain-containing protein [Planctomycetota bacterium]|nr:MAG: VWA domain-containing protein [Planctomycetota bacterium]
MLKRVDGEQNTVVGVVDAALVGERVDAEVSAASPAADVQVTGTDAVPEADLAELEEGFDEPGWLDTKNQAFLVSLLFHVVVILALAVFPIVAQNVSDQLTFTAAPRAIEEEFTIVEDIAYSEEPSAEVGANSNSSTAQALSMAPVLADLSEIPSPSIDPPVMNATYDLNNQLEKAVGLVRSDVVVKGMTGVGATGTDGAVDRITYEILRAMEERPTLVVWFFDQSGSLTRRRQEIRDRFDRIYEELGIVERSREASGRTRKYTEEPLLTSVIAFGSTVNLLTPKPTADIEEIRQAIDSIEMDDTGIERVFSALYTGVEKFKRYRSSNTGRGPERNVLFVAVTDERGDDANGLERTIEECRKFAIPVYVIGVPAPFGREFTYVKYVDPDPKYDQTPQWAQVDQGPESIMPERVKLGFRDDYFSEPVVDSGFGPYALSRLAYETGGIYFTVHPNRRVGQRVRRSEVEEFASDLQYFFDPEVMAKYQPDYVSHEEYMQRVNSSPLRRVLVQAASLPRVDVLRNPTTRFVKRSDAALVTALTEAQRAAARIEPPLAQLAELLKTGEEFRDRESSPRWLAGFDLALGTVLAHKVRAETYNAMLAKLKRGLNFKDPQNNTWVLKPSDEITVGSKLEKEANHARELLQRVATEHRGTPWGLLAERELRNPIGWEWSEEFTDLNPPPSNNRPNNNNNMPRPPRDDQARMLKKPPPKRPIPKL